MFANQVTVAPEQEDGKVLVIPEAVVDAGIQTQKGMSYLTHLLMV
jgi:hypothetical protein